MNNIIGNSARQSAEEVYAEMENSLFHGLSSSDRKRAATLENRMLARRTYDACCDFLDQNRIVTGSTNLHDNERVVSMEAFNNDFNPMMLGDAAITELVTKSGIPANLQDEAKSAVMVLIAKFKACHGNNDLFRNQHFAHGERGKTLRESLSHSTNTVYTPALRYMLDNIGMPGTEAFGANIDKVLPDIRASMAVTLLQFHRGLLDRIIHRRTSASPYVKYIVPYAEVYDMLLSNADSNDVRNSSEHNLPFIELYNDPRSVSNQLQPIVPLVSNDTKSQLLADGYVKFNTKANLFDLSVLPNQLGKTHYNFTDLVSENVTLNSIVIKLHKDSATDELIEIPVHEVNGARFNMAANVNDSGIRTTMFNYVYKLDSNTKTMTGATSTILAPCTGTDSIKVGLNIAALINLKYSDVQALGSVEHEPWNLTGAEAAEGVKTLDKALTITLEGYSVDACYSEENLRKSNLAIRYHVRTFDFEISNGRNIMIDYSFNEELPDFLMSLVTEATSLGQDHRGIDVIIKQMMFVYDTTNLENEDPTFRERLDKIGFQYVAAQQVRPIVYLSTIDLDNVDTIRSSDVLGDIRQYVEWQLLNLTSLYFQNSFYKTQLRNGESPVFKVVTSNVIMDNLLGIPHIHDHLNKDTPADGTNVEYRRVLPNGCILDVVTTTFNYMRDKMVMIPWRENDPEDILNWGHNWDFGTFVAHYNPQIDNAVNKRVFANNRTMVVPTNPAGLYLDVKNISKLVNMFEVASPVLNGSTLPQPSDIIQGE